MMKKICLFLLILLSNSSFGQHPLLDSLKLELKQPHQDSLKAVIYNKIFLKLAYKDNYQAMAYLDTAIVLAKKMDDKKSLGRYYNNKGVIERAMGKALLAMDSYNEALEYAESVGDSTTLLNIYGNVGGIYMYRKENVKANLYMDKILGLVDKEKDWLTYTKTLNNKAILLGREQKFQEKLTFLKEALALTNKSEYPDEYSNLLHNMGDAYYKLGNSQAANEMYRSALELNRETGNTYQEIMNHLNLGELQLSQNKFDEAINSGIKAMQLAEEAEYFDDKGLAHLLLSNGYKGQGDLKQALYHLEAHIKSQQEVAEQMYSNEIAQLQEIFDVTRKEQEILNLRQNEALQTAALSKKNTQLIMGGIVMAMLFVLLILSLHLIRVKSETALAMEKKNIRIETLIRELHHRVKNNLQIVKSLLSLQFNRTIDPETKQAIKEGLNRLEAMAMVHNNLYLDAEVSGLNMEDYLVVLTKSLAASYGFPSETIQHNIDLKNPVFDLDKAVPVGLIVNELVSNAFKYAYESKDLARLLVEIKEKDNKFFFRIKDNGKGIPDGISPSQTQTFGFKLVSLLIEQLHSNLEFIVHEGTEFRFEISK
jgi:two-component system, sensor histidine kinase PdtaS